MDLKGILYNIKDKSDAAFKENCSIIAKGIRDGETTILNLTESLGFLLTDDQVSKQELGTSVLTEVLNNVPLEFLTTQQLSVLAEFYNSKLKEHHQVLPVALLGILTLIQFDNFPPEKVPVILNSIFHDVPCQQQQRADRYTVFQIFDVALKLFKQEVAAMKLEFVYGVLQSIEGERDPRNLLFLFKWVKIFLSEISLYHLTEDTFLILECYFPVDFRAPPNDNSITREDLAEALCPCLCAIPDFGDLCISLALEKLDSSLEIAKLDSLKLLKKGCSTFDTSVYLEKSSEIWSVIQKEILTSNSDEIRSESLNTLSTVISKMSNDENGAYLSTLDNIVDTLKGNLLPDSKLFEKSAQILLYTAAGSLKSCKFVVKEIVPILTNIYSMAAYNGQRSVIVKTLVDFAKVHLKWNDSLVDGTVPELMNIPVLCLELVNISGEPRKIGFDCLSILVGNLMIEIRQKLYLAIQASIFTQYDSETKHSFLQCLKITASHYPDEVKSHVFTNIELQAALLDPLLKSLAALINFKDFRDYVIDIYFEAIGNSDLSKIALKNTRHLVEEEQNNIALLKELIQKNALKTLLELTVKNNCTDIDILQDISEVLKFIMAPQSVEMQKQILATYLDSVLEKVQSCDLNLQVLYGLLIPLKRDIIVDCKIVCLCFDLSFQSQNDVIANIATQLLANLVNKSVDDENLKLFLEKAQEKCLASVMLSPRKTIMVSSWITKALLQRNHPHGLRWLDWLFQLLEMHPEVPGYLKVIMNDSYDSLSKSVHCQKSLLYRQKTFNYVTNKISEKYSQPFYLRALAHLLEFTPQQAIFLQFPKIYKSIILCLEKNDEPEVLSVLLTVVRTVCISDSALLEIHLEDFLNRILKLTRFEASMKIRIESLKCLITLTTSYPVYKLLPLRSTVLHYLGMCVDDRKRLVRKEAMEARSLWFLLDAPV